VQGTAPQAPSFAHLSFGSFHFSWLPGDGRTYSGAEYLGALSTAVKQTPGISDVSLERDKRFEAKQISPPDQTRVLRDGELPFPYAGFTHLTFVIDISESVRDRFSPRGESTNSDIGTRLFVVVAQGWATAQAMVVPLDAPEDFDGPSLGVAIAREFLYDAFPQDGAKNAIYFQCIGPSPAHVDISLQPGKPENTLVHPFWRRSYTRPSYGKYVFCYDRAKFSSGLGAAWDFFRIVNGELDIFYRLVMVERRLRLAWNSVQGDVEQIRSLQAQPGLKGGLRRFRSRRAVGDAFISLADIELEQLEARQQLTRDAKRAYEPGGTGVLQEMVDGEFDDFRDFPIEQVSTVLRLFEDRGLGDRELLVVALSAIIGGLVGAAATLLAGA